jgi:hypothetical protein
MAIALGVMLTLYRNDVLLTLAHSAKQQNSYAVAEKRLFGGPLFGTSQSVDKLIAENGGPLKPVRLPWAVTEMREARAVARVAVASRAETAAADENRAQVALPAAAAGSTQTTNGLPLPSEPAGKAKSDTTGEQASNIAAAQVGESPKPRTTLKPMPTVRSQKKSPRGQAVFRASGKADYYDPLNPTM